MDMTVKDCLHDETSRGPCATIPDLERLCYFFGQLLEPADFRAEQRYFSTRLSLLARYTAGWGVACGLDVKVTAEPAPGCDGEDVREHLLLTVSEGIAVDCCGRLVVLRKAYHCQLDRLLGAAERQALSKGERLYVSIEHVERPVLPTRGLADTCDPLTGTQYGRIRDEARVVVSLKRPEHPDCDTCLAVCADSRVLLASVWLADPSRPASVVVRTDVRRLLARRELATITDVGWVHGGRYERRQAERLLGDGVGLRFSRPIKVASLQEGVVDLVIYEGGRGRRDALYFKEVSLEGWKPGDEYVTEVFLRVAQPEGYQVGDRIHLSVRCDFLLDKCCRAVSGAHLGGGVPFDKALARGDAEHPELLELVCERPPDRSGPWRSGNGVEGGVWESWIKVVADGGPAAESRENAP
jgi:hypothetical protein